MIKNLDMPRLVPDDLNPIPHGLFMYVGFMGGLEVTSPLPWLISDKNELET